MDEKPRHRRLRFGLRTLFEIIAVVAFILALMAYRRPTVASSGNRYESHEIAGSIYVFDAETGQLWRVGTSSGQWYPESRVPTADK